MRGRSAPNLLVNLALACASAITAALMPLAARAEFQVPPLTGPVVDHAGMIPSRVQNQITELARAAQTQNATQIAVLTVEDLGGLAIEQASIQVVDQWGLGKKGSDRGVLLMVARKERAVRIEVGRGLEGELTDLLSKRIVDREIVPSFRKGDFGGGILLGAYSILAVTNPQLAEGRPPRRAEWEGSFSIGWVLFLVMVMIFLRLLFYRSGLPLGGRRWSSGWSTRSGGGWGSGGFGGGGWSGGGGGFSGGGASGRW